MAAPIEEKTHILIVDDLQEKLLVFKTILEELDQNLILVRSGSEALREILTREFAVILLDVNMPDIDGLETARLIRQYKRSAHTPIIFITAYADEMQTAQGYSLGAVDYILSPVNPDVLRSKVKVFVDLYQMQQRTRAMAEDKVARARAEAARIAAEETTRRSNYLARASHELGASLELEQGMRRLLELVVPHMADTAALVVDAETDVPVVFLRRENETRAATGYADLPAPLREALQQVVREGLPLEGETVCYPLRIGDRTLGALALVFGGSPGPMPQDLVTLQELVSRAAIALDNARLYFSLQREIVRSRQAEEELQDANRRKDEFLAMLSHELRNPLAPIRNAVEVIRRLAPPDPKLTMARDVVDRQVSLLAHLVEELLDVSRISRGKIALKKEPIELGRIISHSVETARPLIDARAQTLAVSVPAAPVWLSADFARLSQVVANLLNNASKYTGESGRIELSASAAEGHATITVRDNGAGIESQLLPKVFDLFVQGDRALDRGQGGLGIGLTLVKRLVELHQGSVEVASDGPGRGASFAVTLPCIAEVEPQQRPAQPVPVSRSHEVYGRRILVVDDNVDAAESTAAFLRLEGHEVKAVHDGLQALASLKVFDPHVVVLDIGLPGLDGYAVARQLRERGDTSHVLLIALTGYGQKEDRVRAGDAGFDYHFVKPADPREIQVAIERGRNIAGEPALEPYRLGKRE
ncbi:MAG: chemotaxis protein methyltransferase CheR [Burkholderiales bacterium]|jgi:signal transduction histidine kinase|nr:chemotaxis protein methyltransferase CheR [Burkholderiales bacterium]